MAEEFALCWNNFTDNITTGFQSLLLRGDLCDVTLAVEGKLLKAHKIVLSICSPYFQEMFIDNPCQHPILILKDMKAKLVSNLLEFMYQGAVNVKQIELQQFMKIAETLQIKGLTTSSKQPKKVPSEDQQADTKAGLKRLQGADDASQLPKSKEQKISNSVTDLTIDDDFDPQVIDEQFHIIPDPEVSMVESRFDMNSSKSLDSSDFHPQSSNLKISASQSLSKFSSFDFDSHPTMEHLNKNSQSSCTEVPNEVPAAGSSITMLSSTSLLHGNCIFNRNNTVATQAGLKTYWLCKSYRISMCKARCITHQGKVISATGVHNHLPHMSGKPREIPPGHTPNVFHPTSANNNDSAHSMPSPSSSQQMQHQSSQMMMPQQPYHYLQPTMDHQGNIASINSRHSLNQHSAAPESEVKMSFSVDSMSAVDGSNQMLFKIEHV